MTKNESLIDEMSEEFALVDIGADDSAEIEAEEESSMPESKVAKRAKSAIPRKRRMDDSGHDKASSEAERYTPAALNGVEAERFTDSSFRNSSATGRQLRKKLDEAETVQKDLHSTRRELDELKKIGVLKSISPYDIEDNTIPNRYDLRIHNEDGKTINPILLEDAVQSNHGLETLISKIRLSMQRVPIMVLENPLYVEGGDHKKYILIAGFRRWLSCIHLERNVNAIVYAGLSDEEVVTIMFAENSERADLDLYSKALSALHLRKKDPILYQDIAIARLFSGNGKSVTSMTVGRWIRLASLPKFMNAFVIDPTKWTLNIAVEIFNSYEHLDKAQKFQLESKVEALAADNSVPVLPSKRVKYLYAFVSEFMRSINNSENAELSRGDLKKVDIVIRDSKDPNIIRGKLTGEHGKGMNLALRQINAPGFAEWLATQRLSDLHAEFTEYKASLASERNSEPDSAS